MWTSSSFTLSLAELMSSFLLQYDLLFSLSHDRSKLDFSCRMFYEIKGSIDQYSYTHTHEIYMRTPYRLLCNSHQEIPHCFHRSWKQKRKANSDIIVEHFQDRGMKLECGSVINHMRKEEEFSQSKFLRCLRFSFYLDTDIQVDVTLRTCMFPNFFNFFCSWL